MNQSDVLYETFCSMSAEQWYTFSVLAAHHLNVEKVMYRVRLEPTTFLRGSRHPYFLNMT